MAVLASCCSANFYHNAILSNKRSRFIHAYCAYAVHMQMHVPFFACDGCIRGTCGILLNLSSGGSWLQGGISTNLFLSGFTVTVPTRTRGIPFIKHDFQNNYYWLELLSVAEVLYWWHMQKVDPLQAHDLHDYHRAPWWRVIPSLKWWSLITSTYIMHCIILMETDWSTKACFWEEYRFWSMSVPFFTWWLSSRL